MHLQADGERLRRLIPIFPEVGQRPRIVDRVRTSGIVLHDYRSVCFERPRFADKLCFGWRRAGREIVLSFYRSRAGDLGGVGRLGALANVALTALARAAGEAPSVENAEPGFLDRGEKRLGENFPGLSRREREVCARTLMGWTAFRIGEEMGLSAGTVLTYRQRAHGKLGVSSASRLLPAVLH